MYMVTVQLLFNPFSYVEFVGSHEQEVEEELCKNEPDVKSPKEAETKSMLMKCAHVQLYVHIHVHVHVDLCVLDFCTNTGKLIPGSRPFC